jgi:hypothetical protein
MYRLYMQLPFGVTILHRSEFGSYADADAFRNTLPTGFQITDGNIEGIKVPMKTEEIMAYEKLRLDEITYGTMVFVQAANQRGEVIGVNGRQYLVRMEDGCIKFCKAAEVTKV